MARTLAMAKLYCGIRNMLSNQEPADMLDSMSPNGRVTWKACTPITRSRMGTKESQDVCGKDKCLKLLKQALEFPPHSRLGEPKYSLKGRTQYVTVAVNWLNALDKDVEVVFTARVLCQKKQVQWDHLAITKTTRA